MAKKKSIRVDFVKSCITYNKLNTIAKIAISGIENICKRLKISRRILATSVVQLGGFLINKNIVYACSGNEPVTASYHDF